MEFNLLSPLGYWRSKEKHQPPATGGSVHSQGAQYPVPRPPRGKHVGYMPQAGAFGRSWNFVGRVGV